MNRNQKKINGQIAEYIKQQKNNTFNYKQVSAAIGAQTPAKQRLVALRLSELSESGELVEVSPGKYKVPARSTY